MRGFRKEGRWEDRVKKGGGRRDDGGERGVGRMEVRVEEGGEKEGWK